jgi:hypothetical protein
MDEPWVPAQDDHLAGSTPGAPELACPAHDAHGYRGVPSIALPPETLRRGLRLVREYHGNDLVNMQTDEFVEASPQ